MPQSSTLRHYASSLWSFHNEVPESQRADAANSLVYEANVRLRDPVYGCMGAISALQQQVQALQVELTAIRSDILKYKQREAVATLIAPSNSQVAAGFHNSAGVSVIAPPPQTPSTPPQPSAAHPPPPPPSSCVFSQPTYGDIENEHNSYFG
ncbi:LOB domain-containing protein 15-like [Raphanus sativus]|uniref:LOB domain-containing protein 15-like n=1 Tax=Raphanus sativus TaxID=3726 RepID=A0A6J0M3R6_RAPSA|nr:LOB domain-containing protein 15-like [Raphanus sativus]